MSFKTFRLDPWGDLILRIGPDGEAEDYVVDPRALARASPVFERMLYGDFAEGNQSAGEAVGGWTVRLPGDNPWTMGRFLSTMPGNYDESLASLSIDELYDLILVAHYYDAIKLLQSWAGARLDHVKSLTEDVHAPALKMLWVAWELGSVPLVHEICRCIVLEFDAADLASALCDASVQTPPGVLEHLKSAREERLFSLLQPLRDLVDQLLVVDESPRWCRHAVWMGPHRCESIILGSLVFSLSRAQLWPLPEIADASSSIAEIYSHLTNLTIHDLGEFETTEDHSLCNPLGMIRSQTEIAVSNLALSLASVHRDYVERQVHVLGRNSCGFMAVIPSAPKTLGGQRIE